MQDDYENQTPGVIGRAEPARAGRFKTGHLRRQYLPYCLSVKEDRYGESAQDGQDAGDYRLIGAGLVLPEDSPRTGYSSGDSSPI